MLFVGGSGGDLRQRPSVLEGPLTRSFELLAYDQRGLGRSSKPEAAYSMADYGDDAAGLLDHVGWATCSVVGVSFGGMVAQELAIRHPGRVGRLVLCCTSPGGEGRESYPLHELADLEPDERARRQLAVSDTRLDEAWQRDHPDGLAALVAMARERSEVGADEPGAEDGPRRQLEARRHHDTWDRLASIACPTLVCAGRFDGIAPLANSEALVERIPDARLDVFDGGHLFLLQDRRAWPAIADFLAG